jgi:hypothetical protein
MCLKGRIFFMDTVQTANALSHIEVWQWLLIGVVGAFLSALLFWCIQLIAKSFHRNKDRRKIYKWLYKVIVIDQVNKWRSTKSIASYTHIDEARVRYICGNYKKICRNTGKEDTWGLTGISRPDNETDEPNEPTRIYNAREFNS